MIFCMEQLCDQVKASITLGGMVVALFVIAMVILLIKSDVDIWNGN